MGLSGVNAQQFWSLTSDDPMGHLPISDDKGRFVMDLDAAAFQNTLTNSKGINFLVGKDQVEMVLPNEWGKEEVFELKKAAYYRPNYKQHSQRSKPMLEETGNAPIFTSDFLTRPWESMPGFVIPMEQVDFYSL